ncbi:PAS domain S-box protein [Massilia sp. 9096]|uniref:PAS domain S-box protein n=1 Tax=Massilia sp. 9096 TaxID=1500894 RepID=UPI000A7BE7FC|nr:PAS domain S-box protein [Massilia sp. 9096]
MASDPTTQILLVDDQPANLAVLEAILANLDVAPVSVSSGEAALREVLAHDFAVVLLDVRMPTMNGFELARLIREHPRTQGVPIIFLTAGDGDDFPVEEAYALGAVDYMIKPFNPTVLRAKVSVFIELYRQRAELARIQAERHRAALRSRDERLRLILDNIRDYAFIGTDVTRRITEWEGGAAAITGWSAAQARGQSVDILFTPEDRADGQPELEARRALEEGRAEDLRWHIRRDGKRFFAEGVTVPLRDEGGTLRGFAKILRDATAEKLAREELARSERRLGESHDRFSLLLASSGEGIFGLDREGRCTFLNPAGAALLGYRADELEGRTLHDVIHRHPPAGERGDEHGDEHDGEHDGDDECPILRAVRDGQALRADDDLFVRRDGSMLPVAYSVYPMVIAGETAGAVLTFTDTTAWRQAAAERERLVGQLQAANGRMRDIFHRTPAFMCVMRGPEHAIELANQRYQELAGGRALAGRKLRDAMPELEGQGFVDMLDKVAASGEAFEGRNLRMLLRSADGAPLEEHFLDLVCLAVREPDGAVSGVLVHGIDVTERTRANLLAVGQRSALELAVTDAPLGDVLDVLAHTAEDTGGAGALASVQLVQDGHLRHAAAPSLPASFVAAADAPPIGADAGPAGCAAWSAAPVSSVGLGDETQWGAMREPMRAHGLDAARALPILAPSGQVLGAFTLYYREARLPGAREQAAMALLANTASLVIGQRHEAAERQAAEHRSRAILEGMSEGFLALDRDWRITYANGAAESVTRRRREDLVGGAFWDLFPELRGGPHEQRLRDAAAHRAASRIEAYDNSQGRWFELNAFPTESTGFDGADGAGMALYFRDETKRRRDEERIRRLAAVAEQSSDFIGIFTPDAGGMYLNPAGRRMAGVEAEADISAWRMIDFFPREDRPYVRDQVLAALAGPAAAWEGELRLARTGEREGDGPIPVYFKGFAVRGADGHTIGLATITRDITFQKRAEDELRRVAADLSEADHRKSEFLATLAHELRNPLAPIRTGLDLLRMTSGAGAEGKSANAAAQARVHAMMDRQLGHLIHLVDDLLDIARITRGKIELKKETVSVAAIVNTALETSAALIESHGHRLDVELDPEPMELEADTTRMVQVLSNLLNNAAKYTPRGGRITVSSWREDGHAVISVADNGIGIPQDAIGSVFEMFTQVRGSLDRAQGGLGIGLSLVRRLVELHGGRVSAFSGGPGHGSTFTLRLPLRPGTPHARMREGAATQPAGATARLRVLVVDDNLDAADSLVALLEILGHSARVAHDGPQGLRMAQELKPDLVLLDIGLPGMSGYDVARAIRAGDALPRTVLIALTGWGGQSDLEQSQEAGFDQHLTKPVSLEALEQALGAAARALP